MPWTEGLSIMTQAELLDLHVKALFSMDGNGRLVSINEPWDNTKPAPLLYVGQTSESGPVLYTRYDVDDELRRRANDLLQRSVAEPKVFADLLHAKSVSEELCYLFPRQCPANGECVLLTADNIRAYDLHEFGWLMEEIDTAQPCAAFLEDRKVVSVCRSVRISGAHEAGIETAVRYRGNGYAGKVLAAWSAEVHQLGRTSLYSTSKANLLSQRVADKFGLRLFATGFSIDKPPAWE